MSRIEGVDYTDLSAAELIEQALKNGEVALADSGAIYTTTGARTDRAPSDRFIVREPSSEALIDWGAVNQPFEPAAFEALWDRVKNHLAATDNYISHLHIGACDDNYLPLIVTCETAWHSLFARNIFVQPSHSYNCKDKRRWRILHAANFSCQPERDGTHSDCCVIINFAQRKVLLAGMKYAGELKTAMFSVQNFLLPERDVLPMHCAANVGIDSEGNSDTCLFFGLSGTGKTTLSADPKRYLIGADEHGWARARVFNFEGGCYAKTIDLTAKSEPIIWKAIRFGAVVENVVVDSESRRADYTAATYSKNGRCCYPLDHIQDRVEANFAGEAEHVIFLTCDVTGVLPPVAILSKEAAAYHFLSGYTARVGSAELPADRCVSEGLSPAFSACFGAPFMPRPARVYADLLMRRIEGSGAKVFLVNTGWTGGSGDEGANAAKAEGRRFPVPVTRAIVSAIQSGELDEVETRHLPTINLHVPLSVTGVDEKLLNPREAWSDTNAYDRAEKKLAKLFSNNIENFTVSASIKSAGPKA